MSPTKDPATRAIEAKLPARCAAECVEAAGLDGTVTVLQVREIVRKYAEKGMEPIPHAKEILAFSYEARKKALLAAAAAEQA